MFLENLDSKLSWACYPPCTGCSLSALVCTMTSMLHVGEYQEKTPAAHRMSMLYRQNRKERILR